MARPSNATLRQAALGTVGVLALVAIVRVAFGMFVLEYADVAPVTVQTDRSGLLTDPNAPVKYRGVVVGRVESVRTDGSGAELLLALDPDRIGEIPAGVTANVQPLTVLGAKYVDLVPPAKMTAARLASGAVIERAVVATEFNQAFSQVMDALDALQPARLNTALYAMASALDGNGKRLHQIIEDGSVVVAEFKKRTPAVLREIAASRRVADSYADLTPDLLGTLKQGGAISDSLTAQRELLAGFLGSLTNLGYDMTSFLTAVQAPLGSATSTLRPALELLGKYSPELPCLLEGTAKNAARFRKIMGGPALGGTHRNVNVNFTIGRSLPAYTFPENLPKVGADDGPSCHGLPNVTTPPPYSVYDVGANPYPTTSDDITLPKVPLGLWLFGKQFELKSGVK